MGRITRRGLVAGAVAGVVSACGETSSGETSSGEASSGKTSSGVATAPNSRRTPTTTEGPTTPAPTPTAGAEPTLPTVTAWHPDPNDLAPHAKLTAVRRIERAGNGRDRALHVIFAQYGGLLTDSASVLVVTRSWRRTRHAIETGGHTYDVRLTRTPRGWRITEIRPSRPGPPARELTSAAVRVLRSDRIHLPPAATSDVRSGRVHESVLGAMLTMSTTYRIDVSVVRSGHPIHVFGTDRLSDHPQGRAFDTWAIDDRRVVSARTPRSLVEEYMHAAADAGSYNVGGPYLLGPGPQWFSDDTHHDHVHAGFTT